MAEDTIVSFSLKELLTDIRVQLGSIDSKLDGKADRVELTRVEERLSRRIDELAVTAAKGEIRWAKLSGVVAGISLAAGGTGSFLVQVISG